MHSLGRTFRVLFSIEGIFYSLYLLHSAFAFCNQIIPMTSMILICKMKLVLIQKDLHIFNCNSAHHQLNIPQQHPHSDLRFNFNKSTHATAVVIFVRSYSIFCSIFNQQQWHPTCEFNLHSYWTIRPKRGFAAIILKWESDWHQNHSRGISQQFSQHPTAYLLTRSR